MNRLKAVCTGLALVIAVASARGEAPTIYSWKTRTGRPGGAGNSDGPGSIARFWYPASVAYSAGNLYVADTYNNTIRKVTGGGLVTTLAGSPGESGSTDGPASAARFSAPSGLAVDNAGNVYVADSDNHTIRKVATNGLVSTLAGRSGEVGAVDGPANQARFNSPYGVAVDAAGNVYIADAGNSTIRKLSTNGLVTTLAGTNGHSGSADGTGSAARFYLPSSVALDNAGNLYVADLDNSTIRKVTPGGVVATLAGTAGVFGSADGTNASAQFNSPSGVAVDSAGNVYVADTYNSTIRKVTSDGVVTTLAGLAGEMGDSDGGAAAARFFFPAGLAVTGSGTIYVADTYNSTIRKAADGIVTTLAGATEQSGSMDASGTMARFNTPYGIDADGAGGLFIADTYNHTIRKVTSGGLVSTFAGSPGQPGATNGTGAAARFLNPSDVVQDSAGNVYVADSGNHFIRKISPAGVVTTFAGSAGQFGSQDGTGSDARFFFPYGLALDSSGTLFVADLGNSTIRAVTSSGVVSTLAGSPGQVGSTNGTGSAARFNSPSALALDPNGNIYVADAANSTIRLVTPAGVVTTVAGSPGATGSVDGTGSAARFYSPLGLAVDNSGVLWVADLANHTIRRITTNGVVTTVAGSPGLSGSLDGTGAAARFMFPAGLAADATGNIFVVEAGNHTVRKVTGTGIVTTLAGKAGQIGTADISAGSERFSAPSGVAVDPAGNLYVADTYNSTIRKVTPDGAVNTLAGVPGEAGAQDGPAAIAHFSFPFGLAVDQTGTVYVSDSYNNTIRQVTSDGLVTTVAGNADSVGSDDGPAAAALFANPTGIAVDTLENIYVADSFNSTIRKIAGGTVTTVAGSAGQSGSLDGPATSARFDNPNGVAVDSSGTLFVADSGNSTIRKITSTGVVSTLAGSPGLPGSVDGMGASARFDFPFAVAVDNAGHIFVADAGNSTIRLVTTNGVVTTIGGSAGVIGGTDGLGTAATFAGPSGIAVGSDGRVYVADAGNNRISKGTLLPALQITRAGPNLKLTWPSPSFGFALQENPQPNHPGTWSIADYPVTDDGTNKSVVVDGINPARFFRLISD